MKILVISLAGIGDTILATPLLHELRLNYPTADIEVLVMWAGSRDILVDNPHINAVHFKNLMRASRAEAFRFLWGLRGRRYDLSINTHPQSRVHYRAAAWVVAAPQRFSHRYECSGRLDELLISKMIEQDYTVHTVENNRRLLEAMGARRMLEKPELIIPLAAEDHAAAEQFLREQDLLRRPWLGVHVGSGGTKNLALKRWPLEHYVTLFHWLRRERPELPIVLFGGPEEEPEMKRIIAEHDSRMVLQARTKTLKQVGALLMRCGAFLSVDTALMHLAAAVRAPGQIVIEAPTFNTTNEPFGNPFHLVRNPSLKGRNLDYYRYDGRGIQGTEEELHACMRSVTVDAVLEAIQQTLPART
jgi:ADP-heptose:LPS heptosyltransferase